MKDIALTAAEMIVELQKLPPDTVLRDTEYDDWAVAHDTMEYGFEGVTQDGYFKRGKFLRSYYSWASQT